MPTCQVENLFLTRLHALDVLIQGSELVLRLGGVEAQQLGQAVAVGAVLGDAQLEGLAILVPELGILFTLNLDLLGVLICKALTPHVAVELGARWSALLRRGSPNLTSVVQPRFYKFCHDTYDVPTVSGSATCNAARQNSNAMVAPTQHVSLTTILYIQAVTMQQTTHCSVLTAANDTASTRTVLLAILSWVQLAHLLLCVSQLLEHVQRLSYQLLANGLQRRLLLQHLAGHVEGQRIGINHANQKIEVPACCSSKQVASTLAVWSACTMNCLRRLTQRTWTAGLNTTFMHEHMQKKHIMSIKYYLILRRGKISNIKTACCHSCAHTGQACAPAPQSACMRINNRPSSTHSLWQQFLKVIRDEHAAHVELHPGLLVVIAFIHVVWCLFRDVQQGLELNVAFAPEVIVDQGVIITLY